MHWIRSLLRGLADEGRTVFLSSHLMSEMALIADQVIIIGRGRLLRDQSLAQFTAEASAGVVCVRSPQAVRLAGLLVGDGVVVRDVAEDELEVEGLPSEQIGTVAAENQITLYQLATQAASLEEAYLALTEDSVDYRALPASSDGRGDKEVAA